MRADRSSPAAVAAIAIALMLHAPPLAAQGAAPPPPPEATVYTPERPPSPERPIRRASETRTYASSDMSAVLMKLADLGAKPIADLDPAAARAQPTPADAVKALLEERGKPAVPAEVASTRDIAIPGAAGEIAARIYMPTLSADSDALPVIAYWHGGGWVIGSIDAYDGSARALADGAEAIVVSFDYRLAPEHAFPAAHEDAWAAYRWIVENAASLGGDPQRIAVAGESAGANLAANVAMRARDEGAQPPIHQLLVYPVAGGTLDTPSYVENRHAEPLDEAAMRWFFGHYLKDEALRSDKRIALIEADLEGLAPATVITAELDPLRSEGRALAERMAAAGVDVNAETFPRVTHEFFGLAPLVPEARDAQMLASGDLKRAFGTHIRAR